MTTTSKTKLTGKSEKLEPSLLEILGIKGSDFEKELKRQLKNHKIETLEDLHKTTVIVDAYNRATAVVLEKLLIKVKQLNKDKGGK